MKMKDLALTIAMIAFVSGSASVGFTVKKSGDSRVDPEALTIKGRFGSCINGKSYQQDAVISYNGYQYLAYYDGDRQVCLGRRELPTGDWKVIRFKDYAFKSNDGHNMFSMGVCPQDGTIHLSFDHHGNDLHYRVSLKDVASKPQAVEWDASLFGPVRSELESGKKVSHITYPRFWQTPDGGLQFSYRSGGSGNGESMLVDYDGKAGTWSGTRQINSGQGVFDDGKGQSGSRNAYPNGYTYDRDGTLHTTWVWREGAGTANHDLMHAYSKDQGKTWISSDGQKIEGLACIDTPGITVAKISSAHGLPSMHGQAIDSRGGMHTVMLHCTDESLAAVGSRPGAHRWGLATARRYHHYWRDSAGKWQHTELPWVAGNRAKVFFDKQDNIYLIYGEKHEVSGSKKYYGPLNLCIAAATAKAKYTDWKVVHREKGAFFNEMLMDPYRWEKDEMLSVMVQELPKKPWQSTSLRILDFALTAE
jgi:hypothetical protein